MTNLKKILLPVTIALGALALVFLVLTAVIGIMGKSSAGQKKASDDYTETDMEEAVMVSGYSLTDFSYDTGFVYSGEGGEESITDADPLNDPDGFILPESASREITDADLDGKTAQELYYARNEIYARYGYVFSSDELNLYFQSKNWYTPNADFNADTSAELSSQYLSQLELDNAEYIKTYMTEHELTYELMN